MRILSFIIISLIMFFVNLSTDSPHGADFKVSCTVCHSAKGWELDKEIYAFDHNTTKLPLVGQHKTINCKMCHTTLVFSQAKSECVGCHTDVHSQTLGLDCERCHTPNSWIVGNVKTIHQQSRFPLIGVHSTADCLQCHKAENILRFDVLGVACVDCHRDKYLATTMPNHTSAKFSNECIECHFINSYEWAGKGFNHDYFPLKQGHAIQECTKCHKNNDYNLSKECYSCHEANYRLANNPNHVTSGFPTDCSICHSLAPSWRPADFKQHDSQYFPISSGKHKGLSCSECHLNASDYKIFSCIDCHEHTQSKMDSEHDEEAGYSYNSNKCYSCHPRGDKGGDK